MSHTSAPVPPSFGAMGLNVLVCESRTARLPTLPRSVPSRLVTWEMRPPSQTLLPTCLMALTRPSTIGVLSGFWEGNASTAPLARRRAAAVENSNRRVLLIPISFFSSSGRRRKGRSSPPRYVTDGGNNTPSLRTDTSAGGSTSPGTLPHKQLPRPPSTRSSQNSVNRKSNFGELTFLEVRRTRKKSQDLKPRLFHGCSLDCPNSLGRNTGLPRKKYRTLKEEIPDSPGRNTGLSRKKYRTLQEIRSTVFLQTTGFCERCSCAPVCVLLYCCSLTTEV